MNSWPIFSLTRKDKEYDSIRGVQLVVDIFNNIIFNT